MMIGPPPDVMKPDFHGARTHWNWGFMTFQLVRRDVTVRRTRTVMLTVPMWPESGCGTVPPGRRRTRWPAAHALTGSTR
jgi:hypothetical protein